MRIVQRNMNGAAAINLNPGHLRVRVGEEDIHNHGGLQMPLVTQSDIEQLYAQSYGQRVELSSTLLEYHMRRGRRLRAQESARLMKQAGSALWRLLAALRLPSGRFNPSNV